MARGKRVRITAPGNIYIGTTDGLEPNGLLPRAARRR